MAFKDRNEVIGHEVLTIPGTGLPATFSAIPPGTAYVKIWYNPTGATGTPEIALSYWTTTPTASDGIQFSDLGGFIVIEAPQALQNFEVISLDGKAHELQVYYHQADNI